MLGTLLGFLEHPTQHVTCNITSQSSTVLSSAHWLSFVMVWYDMEWYGLVWNISSDLYGLYGIYGL